VPSLTVVIVNFNSGPYLARCLASLDADLAAVEWTGVVVDNASTDGSVDSMSAAGDGRVTVIRNATNIGFGAAVNQAARGTSGTLLWLINPDCEIEVGAFEALRETLSEDPRCAVAAPQLLNADGSVQESARGEPTAWTGLFGRHGLLTRVFPGAGAARHNLRAREIVQSGVKTAEIDWAMGACLLIRREVFDRVSGFDERFFLYWEDADLCRRIRDLGYVIRYVPRARVVHVGAASSRTARRMAGRAFHRSAYLYYAKHTVPSRWHPARALAWLALRVRGWWRTTVARA
jgi:N-acetylglucosaminyl-diphospho-decaprenol L-rhamnosyltransferase